MIDKLHYISQQPINSSHLLEIGKALNAGCKWIQLRVKDQPPALILKHAFKAKELCDRYSAKLIVNDHPEIALKIGAYGVHLGLRDMPVAEARRIVGQQIIIGGTANTFQHIVQRIAEGADYIGLGPYRFTNTKKTLSPVLGLEGYKIIMHQLKMANINIPVLAIGGILPRDITSLVQAGIYGAAVSGAISHAADPAQIVKNMYQQLNDKFTSDVVK